MNLFSLTLISAISTLVFSGAALCSTTPVGTLDSARPQVFVLAAPSDQQVKTHPMNYANKFSIAIEGKTIMGDTDVCIITPELAARQMLNLIDLAAKVKSGETIVSCEVDAHSIAQKVLVSTTRVL